MAKKKSSMDALKDGLKFDGAAKQASEKITHNSNIAQSNNSTPKKFKAIRIDKDLHLQFKAYTASIGESMTAVVEQLITEYLDNK